MKVYTDEDFNALIANLPQDPATETVYQALLTMRDENSVIRQPYTFDVDFSTGAGLLTGAFAAPAPGGNTVGQFLVDSSSPFMLVSGTYRSDLAGAAQTDSTRISPNQTVFIQDQSGNRNWMNVAVPVTSLFGDRASLPYFWPQPKLVPANTTVLVTLFNYEAANTPNTRLSFHGYRFYSSRT
jgi:hypothetical protein